MDLSNDEVRAYVHRSTGELALVGEDDLAEFDEPMDGIELPDWQKEVVAHARRV